MTSPIDCLGLCDCDRPILGLCSCGMLWKRSAQLIDDVPGTCRPEGKLPGGTRWNFQQSLHCTVPYCAYRSYRFLSSTQSVPQRLRKAELYTTRCTRFPISWLFSQVSCYPNYRPGESWRVPDNVMLVVFNIDIHRIAAANGSCLLTGTASTTAFGPQQRPERVEVPASSAA